MAAPEIHRGDFVYRDTFFAEVGENKRHPRASVAEIRDLLIPKQGSAPAKDNVGHWYEAQLLHYGLPRSKDKSTAKIRLLQAVTQGPLAIPPHLLQMEEAMKKDYAAAGRKVKAEAKKADQKTADEKTVSKGKKRKQDETESTSAKGASTNISVTVGEVTFNINHQSGPVNERGAKKQKRASAAESAPKSVSKLDSKAKETPTEKNKKAKATLPPDVPKTTETTTKKRQTARKSTGSAGNPAKPPTPVNKSTATATKPSNPKNVKPSPSPHLKQTARRTQPPTSTTSFEDVGMTDAPPPYEAYDPTNLQSRLLTTAPNSRAVQISGFYPLTSPDLHHNYSSDMSLRIDHPQDKLWGRFDFGSKSGVIMVNGITPLARGDKTSFGWRSRDEEDGSLRFGRGCDGRIEFDGSGFVRGVFFGLMDGGRDVRFEGEREYDGADEAGVFEGEWDEFVEVAYGRG